MGNEPNQYAEGTESCGEEEYVIYRRMINNMGGGGCFHSLPKIDYFPITT